MSDMNTIPAAGKMNDAAMDVIKKIVKRYEGLLKTKIEYEKKS